MIATKRKYEVTGCLSFAVVDICFENLNEMLAFNGANKIYFWM